MDEKVNTILATNGEESFEFAPVRNLGDQFVSNVQNHSHDDGEAHIHPVFFEVGQGDAGVNVKAVKCGCPSDEYHDGPCKHREAASDCAKLLGHAIEADANATDESDSGQPVATDGGHPEEACTCEDLPEEFPCWNCFKKDGKEIRTDGGQPAEAADDGEELSRLADGQIFEDGDGTRWRIDKRVTRVPTPSGTVPRTRLVAGESGEVTTIDTREFVQAERDGDYSLVSEGDQ